MAATARASRAGAAGPVLFRRILLLGGASEIGMAIVSALRLPPDAEVILAGRDEQQMAAAGNGLGRPVRTLHYDATELAAHESLIAEAFSGGEVDLVISAAGVLIGQADLEDDPLRAGMLIETNFTGHVTTLLAAASRMRAQGSGVIVILSSVAAVRPRQANLVYGAAKAGLDAFGRGLADSMHGSGVRVLLVRPGFVIGRMTRGLTPAPLATTPPAVGRAVANGLDGRRKTVWVPSALAAVAVALRVVPRPLWRRIQR